MTVPTYRYRGAAGSTRRPRDKTESTKMDEKKKNKKKKRFPQKKKKKKKKTGKNRGVPQRPRAPRLERPGEPRALFVDGKNAPVMHIVQHAPELLRQRRKPRLQGRVHRLDPWAVALHEKKKKKKINQSINQITKNTSPLSASNTIHHTWRRNGQCTYETSPSMKVSCNKQGL
jgi:hypothetical protein